jgi:glycosyltransferase involved in cell wall biosynthesis
MSVDISAIICTYNRAGYLIKAIESLIDQWLPQKSYEIIVVDNCSTDSTKEILENYLDAGNIRYIFEPSLGLSYARNAGWRNAMGKYVAFLDDDAIASPVWLKKIVDVFETVTPRPGSVGGKVEPIWEGPRPKWLSEWLLHGLTVVDWSDTPHFLNDMSQKWLAGANIAFPVEILASIGGFSSSLGRVGKTLLSGEEVFLIRQLLKAGHTCFYHPQISVSHHILKSRLNKSWFVRRYYWQGVSDAAMELHEETISVTERIDLAFSRTLNLLQSPKKLARLLIPSNDPTKFTEKCFALIEVGHIVGLLGVVKRY